jgi:hypothetical protein
MVLAGATKPVEHLGVGQHFLVRDIRTGELEALGCGRGDREAKCDGKD